MSAAFRASLEEPAKKDATARIAPSVPVPTNRIQMPDGISLLNSSRMWFDLLTLGSPPDFSCPE